MRERQNRSEAHSCFAWKKGQPYTRSDLNRVCDAKQVPSHSERVLDVSKALPII